MTRTRRASQDCHCPKYLNLLAENARLTEEVARLKAKLARQERTAKEQPFGLSTPSPQRLVEPSLPKTRLTNRLLARVAREHYHDGNTTDTVADRLGVPRGTSL